MASSRLLLALGFAVILAALVFVSAHEALAHGGGLDRYGCHRDNRAGTYHWHRGPCAGQVFGSQTEMLKAACARK